MLMIARSKERRLVAFERAITNKRARPSSQCVSAVMVLLLSQMIISVRSKGIRISGLVTTQRVTVVTCGDINDMAYNVRRYLVSQQLRESRWSRARCARRGRARRRPRLDRRPEAHALASLERGLVEKAQCGASGLGRCLNHQEQPPRLACSRRAGPRSSRQEMAVWRAKISPLTDREQPSRAPRWIRTRSSRSRCPSRPPSSSGSGRPRRASRRRPRRPIGTATASLTRATRPFAPTPRAPSATRPSPSGAPTRSSYRCERRQGDGSGRRRRVGAWPLRVRAVVSRSPSRR